MCSNLQIKHIIDDPLTKELININIFDKIINNPKGSVYHSAETSKAMKAYAESLQQDTQGDRDCAIRLWKELLIDAIYLLKINDSREKLYTLKKNDSKKIIYNFNKIRNISSFGIVSLEEYFNDFVEFEAVLYTEKYYRDHIHHVIQVWGIGVGLLFCNNRKRISLTFSEDIKYSDKIFHDSKASPQNKISRTELWAMWTIVALCHDLGYPLEKASKINQKVKNIVAHFGCKDFVELNFKFDIPNTPLIEKFLKIISSKTIKDGENYHTEVQQKYYDKFSKSLEEYRHGMFSGFLLFKVLVYFLETDFSPHKNTITPEDRRQFLIRREMLRAICCHTCPTICDEIQEWDRPRFDDLYCTREASAPKLRIKKFLIKDGLTNLFVCATYDSILLDKKYNMMEAVVINKYKMFVYLLRSAKDDGNRKIIFHWKITFADYDFDFIFDTQKNSIPFSTTYTKIGESEPTDFDLFKKDVCKEILGKQS